MWTVRIYGALDDYGGRSGALEEVLEVSLSDFPQPGDHVRVCFGRVPSDVLRAVQAARTYMLLVLTSAKWRNAPDPDRTLEQLASQRVEETEPLPQYTSEYGLWTTLVIERPTDIRLGPRSAFRFGWPDVGHAIELADPFLAEVEPAFDVLSAAIMTVVPRGLLAVPLSRGQVYFSSPGKEPFTTGRFEVGTPTVSLTRRLDDIDAEQVRRRLAATIEGSAAQREIVATVARWRAAIIGERDVLRRFQFAFFGIEILISKLWKRYLPVVVDRLQTGGILSSDARLPVAELIWPTGSGLDRENPNRAISFRFAVVASGLSPATAVDDTAAFKTLLRARNELAHGSVHDFDHLPAQQTEDLFDRYLDLVLRDVLRA